ncbi:MAG: hypothetical protein RLY57_746 [Candidatus Parcubacteria bacterium]|jgi:hypothetical protein
MSDDELQDGEERHNDDAPLNIDEEDLEEVAPEDGEIPLEEAVDGVLVGDDDEELDYESHDDVDPF